jgi:hypothetical protein
MRTPRTEIISVDTDRIARHAFAKTEFVCLRAVPMAGNITSITTCTAAEWKLDAEPHECWFRNERDVAKILEQMVTLEGMFWTARRIEGGVLLGVAVDRVGDVIGECLKWQPSVSIVSADEINAHIASVKQELDRSLVQMQVTGAMSRLNKQYKELRTRPRAEGEKIPSFKVWLTQQLEARILQPVPASL